MFELIVIGGGPAGLAAACRAWEDGLRRILVVERDKELGGILNQCIHNGFGLHRFQEELTGPEYAGRFLEMLRATGVQVQLDTMALQLVPGQAGAPHTVHCVSAQHGYQALETAAVVLAMGCRERTRAPLPFRRAAQRHFPRARPSATSIWRAMVGRRVVILGSGDIGLIMARRMSLEGAKVLACVELMPYSSGLTRNIVQCLQDYGIPLYLSHTVTGIRGHDRLEQVTVSRVDEQRRPIPGTEMVFECDTLLLSVGLIPENELTRQAGICMDTRTGGAVVYENMETSVPGIFACGNVVHVHDLVDYVSAESERAGAAAAAYVQAARRADGAVLEVKNGTGVSYTVPQHVRAGAHRAEVFFRVNRVLGASRIVVQDAAGVQIAQYRRERMAPGEMEHIVLPAALLQKAQGALTLHAQEVAQA
ncbi:MAG: NAD(P)/FAD-dependent oxidoreductase [Ruthenibacterium sp.]